ncbi:MAG: hypothetical protein ACYTFG_16450 [Planctomycetota bacterium]|jgi:hypothetical protein
MMKPSRIVVWLAVAGMLTTAGYAQEVVRESRVFDIEFLTVTVPDYPGPNIKIRTGAEEAMPPMMDMEEGLECRVSADVLVSMIRVNVDPDSWNNVKNKIQVQGGKLIITHTRENLGKIALLLDDLRSRVGDFVEVEAFVLKMKMKYLEGLISILESNKKAVTLGRESVKAILGRSVKEGFVRVVDSASVLAFSGQRVHAASLKTHTIVRDIDVEVAVEKEIEDPVLGVVDEGFVLDVRPTVGAGELGILLDLKLQYQSLKKPIDSVETQTARIDLPEAANVATRTTLVLPDGGATLFSARHGDDGDDAYAFLVRARRKGLKAAKRPKKEKSEAKRIMHVYNVRILTSNIEDYEAPKRTIGMSRGGEGGAAAPMFEAEEAEGIAITGDDLVALVTTNIEEDSWSNDRNSISFSGGCLVVVQTAEVHQRIDAFLKSLRSRRVVLAMMCTRYLSVDDRLIAEMFPEGPGGVHTHLDATKTRSLLAACKEGDRAKVLALTNHVAFNRQWTHIFRRNVSAYIGDLDAEVAQKAGIHDPIIRTVADGILTNMKCVLTGDGKHITLELLPKLASVKRPFREMKFKTDRGEALVQMPDLQGETIQTSVTIPDGGTVLFFGGRSITKEGRRLVLLVSVNLIRLGR